MSEHCSQFQFAWFMKHEHDFKAVLSFKITQEMFVHGCGSVRSMWGSVLLYIAYILLKQGRVWPPPAGLCHPTFPEPPQSHSKRWWQDVQLIRSSIWECLRMMLPGQQFGREVVSTRSVWSVLFICTRLSVQAEFIGRVGWAGRV